MNKKILAFAILIIACLLIFIPVNKRLAEKKALRQQEEARLQQEEEVRAQKEEAALAKQQAARAKRQKALARKNKALAQLDSAVEQQLSSKPPRKNQVLAAVYLDDNDQINDYRKRAEYRCYFIHSGQIGGFTGGVIPYNAPWTGMLYTHNNEFERKIVIDAGPQYEYITKDVTLEPGQVTNLGYVKLEKVSEKPIASIHGVVKGEDGQLLEGAKVSSLTNHAVTDSDGSYSIDVFRVGECRLKATKSGYVSSGRLAKIKNTGDRIDRDITLPVPRDVTIRYMIVPREIDDFNSPKATGGTISVLVNEVSTSLLKRQVKSEDLKKFIDETNLRFDFRSGNFVLRTGYSSVLTELIQRTGEKFEDITSVGELERSKSRYADMKQGNILLLDGTKQSGYKVKILFEKINKVMP